MADKGAEFENVLARLRELDVDSLITNPQWGEITFEFGRADLLTVRELAGVLSSIPLAKIPSHVRPNIERAINDTAAVIDRIRAFSLQVRSPVEEHDRILGSLTSALQELHNQLHGWLPYVAYLHGDIPLQLTAIANAVSSTHSNAAEFEAFMDSRKADYEKTIDEVVSAAREASAKLGVAHFAEDFMQDANAREAEAATWLIVSIGAAVLTVVAAIVLFFVPVPEGASRIVQFTTSKVVVLAMLIGVTAWCAGNYKANKHQAVVSRRKQHALKTFQAFVQSSDNASIRDAVLLETTRFIFSHSHTGYLKADGGTESPSQVIEIIKGSGDASVR